MSTVFQIAVVAPGLLPPSIPIAASRAGELGILDFEFVSDEEQAAKAVLRLNAAVRGSFGIKLGLTMPGLVARLMSDFPQHLKAVIFTSADVPGAQELLPLLRGKNITTLCEARSLNQAREIEALGFDAVIAKGHEAGGRVADETTFILLQRFQAELQIPIWAHGGVGLHTAAACAAANVAGVVLDSQLALTRESPLSESIKSRIASMDGSETICLGEQLGEGYRIYARPGMAIVKTLQAVEARLSMDTRPAVEILGEWRCAITGAAGWSSEQHALMLGQDAAFAAALARSFRTVGGVLQAFRNAIDAHVNAAVKLQPLAEGSALARSHGTRYPILQGPMTRVSDVPEFAAHVAEGGALPFLALALMRGPEVRTLLTHTEQRMGTMPWGVGILGFVPPELRQEQMDVITEFKPPFALIAGGRPDQASVLEGQGITTYLHVPSPGLLQMFLRQGARRFVFEGRECGGHVGPRTSFVLWNQMMDVLLTAPELDTKPEEFHVVFAAGIHDALSAAMVAVLAAPLAERGVKVGVLLGSAYLFTKEAVASGAILSTFQEQAQQCTETILLETGPGHSTRCVVTPYASAFFQEKRRLATTGLPAEEIRMTLEDFNLGRLRIASKGVTRNTGYATDPTAPKLVEIDVPQQIAEGMYMIGQVAALRHVICSVEELHRDIAVEGSHTLSMLADRSWHTPAIETQQTPSDIAIIGMSCLLPKAPDLRTFWENIIQKVDAITEVPPERWDSNLYYDSDPKAKDKIYSKWGGFLDDTVFDPMKYGMPPSTLKSIEPAQLLTLEVVRAGLEDAGYLDREFARERTSVILGAGGGAADLGLAYGARSFLPNLESLPEFQGRSAEIMERLDGRLPEWTEDSFAGILTNVSAGRVANRFDLGGSNYTVDAACASSLAAVSLALKELEGKTSDMVIAGGIDTMQNPFTYLCFSKTHALSPRGRCRTFDESADGIAISEGIAVMVFKRLEDAERDGDRIYAVIKGAGSSSDGKDRGLTAPRPEGQARALRRAYAKAGFSPATVGLVEAHGTGTVAGDTAEVQALTKVFSEAEAGRQGCAIGSVKSMIGHTKCSAGAAGMIKAALALHNKVLPPTLGVQKPNPRARFSETPFFVNTEPRPWLENPGGSPRRAGVSAFGFGGTNFHVVLEEYTGDPFGARHASFNQWSDELFLFSGSSRKDLSETVSSWEKALSGEVKVGLRDLAFTAWKQSQAKPNGVDRPSVRLAIVAASVDDLRQKLTSARQNLAQAGGSINDPRGIYFSEQPLAPAGKIAVLFPGQGSQYPHMLQDLVMHFPEMRATFESASQVLTGTLDQPLSTYIFPPPSFGKEEEQARQKALTQTNVAQPALGAAGLAMFGLLSEMGLRADMLAGHSYGEYVALAAAGVFDARTLIAISEARGRFIVEAGSSEPGVMAAVEADGASVAEAIKNFPGVCVANANAPRQTVISGTRAGVDQAVEHFKARGTASRLIPVACAFHSPLVAGAQPRLAEFLSTVHVAEPSTPVYSNTTAAPYPAEPGAVAARLVEHLVKPVEFAREIEAMYADGARLFVEVGPRSVLTGLVDQTLGDRPKLAVASNQSARPGLTQLLHLLGQLAAQGVALKFDRLYRDRSVRQLDLAALKNIDKPLDPSVWLVNGARAKPLKEAPKAVRKEVPQMKPVPQAIEPPKHAVPAAQAAAPNGIPSVPLPVFSPQAAPVHQPAPVHHAAPGHMDGVAQVMAQFQEMMTHFVDAQKTVMLQFLSAETGAAVAAPPAVPAQPVQVYQNGFASHSYAPAVAPEPVVHVVQNVAQNGTMHAAAAPARVAAEPAPSTSQLTVPQIAAPEIAKPDIGDLTLQLLAIVSDRTGYPAEMLDLTADLEADLGIDSIKRVEILGTFQQTLAGLGEGEGLIDKLAGVRTLQGIVERVAEHIGGGSPVASSVTIAEPEIAVEAPLPSPSPKLGKGELTAQLLSIVSDRTGYPAEMLGLDLDLEADLGIDSIKRVEILGTFQQSFAAMGLTAPDGMLEQLAGVRTLRGIIVHMEGPAESAPAAHTQAPIAVASVPQTAKLEEERIQRFTVQAVSMPLDGVLLEGSKSGVILVTDDGGGVAKQLADKLRGQGNSVAIVHQDRSLGELSPGIFTADLGSSESVSELIELVTGRHGGLAGVVHLASLNAGPAFNALNQEGWRDRIRLGTKSLFYLAKAAHKHLHSASKENSACFLAATAMGGTFMSGGMNTERVPEQAGVAGLMKTLALEWPQVRVRAVDLSSQESSSVLAQHLLDEWNAASDHVEVGYNGSRRVVLEAVAAPLRTDGPKNVTINSSSVVLITGGARGIAARTAIRLAELYRCTLILAGRSPVPAPQESTQTTGITARKDLVAVLMQQLRDRGEAVTPARIEQAFSSLTAEREIRSTLHSLRKLGVPAHYHQVDVRSPQSLGGLIDELYRSFGRLDGVIHAAGVIEDKLVQDKTPESFDRVFDTKVDSAFLLSQKLRPETLQFLVFFSSVSGRFGNRGQADYAAANEVLNKLAVTLDAAWPARVVAINWGPWDNGGMVSAEVRKQFAERGVELISPEVGLRRLEEELNFGQRGDAEVVIGGAAWNPAKKKSRAPAAAPLLRQAAISTLGETREFTRELDPNYDVYLQDHVLDGQPVLPLAMATELMAEAVAQGWPEMRVSAIRDLRMLRGIVLENGPKSIRIVAKPVSQSSVAVEILGEGNPGRMHYRATVELAERLPETSPLQPALLSDGHSFSMSVAELYQQWLFHGPMFQGVLRVDRVGVSGIQAVLASSTPASLIAGSPSGEWLIDPLMFDSALQLLVLWGREHWDMTALPSGFQVYRRFAAHAGGNVLCELRLRPNTGQQTIHADIYFRDAKTNGLIGILEDMQGACSKALNRLAIKESLIAAGAAS